MLLMVNMLWLFLCVKFQFFMREITSLIYIKCSCNSECRFGTQSLSRIWTSHSRRSLKITYLQGCVGCRNQIPIVDFYPSNHLSILKTLFKNLVDNLIQRTAVMFPPTPCRLNIISHAYIFWRLFLEWSGVTLEKMCTCLWCHNVNTMQWRTPGQGVLQFNHQWLQNEGKLHVELSLNDIQSFSCSGEVCQLEWMPELTDCKDEIWIQYFRSPSDREVSTR